MFSLFFLPIITLSFIHEFTLCKNLVQHDSRWEKREGIKKFNCGRTTTNQYICVTTQHFRWHDDWLFLVTRRRHPKSTIASYTLGCATYIPTIFFFKIIFYILKTQNYPLLYLIITKKKKNKIKKNPWTQAWKN